MFIRGARCENLASIGGHTENGMVRKVEFAVTCRRRVGIIHAIAHFSDRRANIMTDTATQLLATFESLSADEQHVVLTQMLRRVSELPEAPMSDDALIAIADEVFQSLDTEEEHGDESNAG